MKIIPSTPSIMAATGQSPLISRVWQRDPVAVMEALTVVGDHNAKVADRIF